MHVKPFGVYRETKRTTDIHLALLFWKAPLFWWFQRTTKGTPFWGVRQKRHTHFWAPIPWEVQLMTSPCGCGSNLSRRAYTGFGPCFHLPGQPILEFRFFFSHSHMAVHEVHEVHGSIKVCCATWWTPSPRLTTTGRSPGAPSSSAWLLELSEFFVLF